MDVGIIGFAGSGKTTLFNALTGSKAEVGGYGGRAEPNVAVVNVPDPRVDRLVDLFKAPKTVRATITYIDVAGMERSESGGGVLDEKLIRAVANCDALLAVIQGFEHGGIDPDLESGAEAIQAELLLSDLGRVETRIERIEKQISKQKADVKAQMQRELNVMLRCREALEAERPVRTLDFDAEEHKILRAFQFMTIKPLILVVNLGEEKMDAAASWEERLTAKGLPPQTAVVACCANNEMEIAQIEDEAERLEFMETYGITQPTAERIIRASYETLGLISFFTAGPKEVHAWTLRGGESVLRAAGTIHSDLERGFIRAEVIGAEELLALGSLAAAKKEGKLRTEGKTYVTQDGDVIEIRFSV
jgi:ribosome-binding ATPase